MLSKACANPPRSAVEQTQLTRRYLLALTLVALLSLLGHGVVQVALARLASDSRVINLAGRQRMLSQKLTRSALLLERGAASPDLRSDLEAFVKAHQGLRFGEPSNGLPGQNSAQVEVMFQQLEPPFQQIVAACRQLLVDPTNSSAVATILSAQEPFLEGMDRLVFRYDLESAQRVTTLRRLEWLFLCLTLVALVFEALFIFRPAVGRVVEALAQAEASSRLKTRFVQNVTHEIRTPLNVILALSGALEESVLSPSQRRRFGLIRSSAELLAALVDDLLDFGKLERGQREVCLQPTQLDSCLEEMLALFAVAAEEKGLDLILRYPGDLPRHFMLDGERLRQVVVNLVANAIQYTEQGHVLVEVSRPGQELVIRVEDTGPGLEPELLPRVFDRFVQGQTDQPGLGLGLAIGREVSELLGGRITVESRPQEGSAFSLVLPAEACPEVPNSWKESPLPRLKVLAVEDHPISREVLGGVLSSWDLDYAMAASAEEAVELVKKSARPFQVALIDQVLPDQDGLSLSRLLGALTPSTKKLLVTSLEVAPEDWEAAGLEGCLGKPLRPRDLLARIRSLTESDWAPRESLFTRLLLVHSDPVQLRVLRNEMEKSGCRADGVRSVEEAARLSRLADYDLVIVLDQQAGPVNWLRCRTAQEVSQAVAELRVSKTVSTRVDVEKLTSSWVSLGGSRQHVLDHLQLFSRTVREHMADLRHELRQGRREGLTAVLRDLTPVLSSLGARTAETMCEGLLGELATMNWESLRNSIDELDQEIVGFEAEVDRLWVGAS